MLNVGQPSEALQSVVLCLGHFVHIYYYSWNSQKILDHSSMIFDAIYNTEWYREMNIITKLLTFMMLRSTKPCIQTAGKLFPMTLMNFTVVNLMEIKVTYEHIQTDIKCLKNHKKLITVVTLQNQIPCRMTAGKLVVLSMETLGMVLGVIVYFDDKETVLESITPFMIDVLVASKYINAIVNVKTMIKLLNRIKENCLIFTNEKEKSILNEYSHIGQFITYGYIVGVYSTTLVFITEPLIPKWINFILQSNETIPNKYPVPIYWYVTDMEENFYPILCYESICIVAIVTITVANDSMFIIFLQHACALFAIVGRQLENLPRKKYLEDNWEYSDKFRKTNDIQYDYYVMCIKNHKRAIEYGLLFTDSFYWNNPFSLRNNLYFDYE
ncbi:hypothetical protein PV328_002782 [Microctonus aethiopoides]|uniref:Odorant receptor n=1 Tax=Microctonus aethiopoides TaxID=144406 RepID=A0AA39F704_9HYME|nr:hypothetical protein PV328_002782 [Microctonus aethiopoides]